MSATGLLYPSTYMQIRLIKEMLHLALFPLVHLDDIIKNPIGEITNSDSWIDH